MPGSPGPRAGAAYALLCREIEYVLRLDEPDPAAWRSRLDALVAVTRGLEALHFEGPGTGPPWSGSCPRRVTGIARGGRRVPLLRAGAWQIGR